MSSIKYAISSGHKVTSEVAQSILENGGNAFDAAVSAYLASFVSEPMMASAGAGGFANILTANGKNIILDFFCQTPQNKAIQNPNYKTIIVDFGESQETFYAGPASMAVPGAMACIQHLAKYYCDLPLKELIQPAQAIAKNGIAYTSFQALDTALLAPILELSEIGKSLFFESDKTLSTGSHFAMPKYADFLEVFAREESDWFYIGEIAKQLSSHSIDNGGYLTLEDLAAYQVIEREPHSIDWKGLRISTPGLPSMGGGLMQLFLSQIKEKQPKILSNKHFMALRVAFAQCLPYVSNPDALWKYLSNPEGGPQFNKHTSGTSHFNILDSKGNAIALSTSIGEGSGYFLPETHMQMNNMLGEPGLMPNGLGSWTSGSRLNSMMCPTLCFDRNMQLQLMIGSGGSSRIPFSIAQVIFNQFQLGLNLDKAIHLPRIFESDQRIYLEKGFAYDPALIEKTKTEWQDLHLVFGGTHAIDLASKTASGDNRREGHAIITYT